MLNKISSILLLSILLISCIFSQNCFAAKDSVVAADPQSIITTIEPNSNTALENLRSTGKAFAEVAKAVSPSVVNIQVEQTIQQADIFGKRYPDSGDYSDPFNDEFFRFFFGRPFQRDHPSRKQVIIGQGSGFIISADGYIVTSAHVVKDASKITIKLQDGRELAAKTIGLDTHSDLAVIKVDAKKLPVLAFGDSDQLEVGEWVVALGNPFGLSHTLTAGIVSAKGRSGVGITDYENFIQTDAAINPGNSGGPLVNLESKVIGINTAIVSQSGGYMGIGFAIPINLARTITDQLINKGSVSRGYFGVNIQDLTEELAKSFKIQSKDGKPPNGVLVAQVMPDSPASKSGIKQGDIITEMDDTPVKTKVDFRNAIALSTLGSTHTLTVLRNGEKKTLKFSVSEKPEEEAVAQAETTSKTIDKLGIEIQNVTANIAERLELEDTNGVLISNVERGGIAEFAGLRPGMVILEINRKQVKNVDEFVTAFEKASKDQVLLLIKNQYGVWFITMQPS